MTRKGLPDAPALPTKGDRVRYIGPFKSVLRGGFGRVFRVDDPGIWVKPLESGEVQPGWYARKDVAYYFTPDELEVVQYV